MEELIFGNKNKVAFEIKQGNKKLKGFLRIWFEGNAVGSFKKQDDYIHVINDFNKFYKNYKILYELSFEKLSAKEIYNYQLAEELIWSKNSSDLEEAERRQIYTRFFGIQFDGLCSFISIYKDDYITFLLWFYKKNKDEYKYFKVKFEDYKNATDEFIGRCERQ